MIHLFAETVYSWEIPSGDSSKAAYREQSYQLEKAHKHNHALSLFQSTGHI